MKVKKKHLNFALGFLVVFTLFYFSVLFFPKPQDKMIDVVGLPVSVARKFAQEHHLELDIKEEYHDRYRKDIVMKQNIPKETRLFQNETLKITVSKGKDEREKYRKYKVNELGDIPVLRYHDIIIKPAKESEGIKVVRTKEEWIQELKYLYEQNYRMISLSDMMDGTIDVPLGKSPIVLTFDGGYENQMRILGETEDGKLKIDPDCAVGILEKMKEKHPDFHVTATFFLDQNLFGNTKYNKKMLKWLVEHGYDVANAQKENLNIHSMSEEELVRNVGGMYELLEDCLMKQYTSVVALNELPNSQRKYEILKEGSYQNIYYQTKGMVYDQSAISLSPFQKEFSKDQVPRLSIFSRESQTLKDVLEKIKDKRYISDGEEHQVTVLKQDISKLHTKVSHEIVSYES